MFLTSDQAIQSVADALKARSVAELLTNAPNWSGIIQAAQRSAYQDIVGRLIKRGFILAQIVSWDRGAEFELDLTKYWSLVNGGGLSGYDPTFIKMLDRRKELDDVMVSVNGVYIVPGQTQPGTINFGTRNDGACTWPGAADSSRHGHHHDDDRW